MGEYSIYRQLDLDQVSLMERHLGQPWCILYIAGLLHRVGCLETV